jgi:hypothetical protein
MPKYEPLTITDEQIAALENEYGDVGVFRGPPLAPWICVVRPPTAEEATAYKSLANDANTAKKITANVKLISALSVFPKKDTEEWKKQYSRWPLFPDGLARNSAFEEFCGIEGITNAFEK